MVSPIERETPVADTIFLYGLSDPRTETVFYIGISANPVKRLLEHKSNNSPFRHRVKEIRAAGQQVQLTILWECRDQQQARHIEQRLVRMHPGLANRQHNYAHPTAYNRSKK
jgi:predicted GIY-YIG superfamily endonuclease